MPSVESSRNSTRSSHNRPQSRSRSRRQHVRREPEEYTLVIDNVPRQYRWQEVKDELRGHATHVSRVHDMEQSGLYSLVINSRTEAFSAYESLKQSGFSGGVPIRVVLTKNNQPIKGPEWGPISPVSAYSQPPVPAYRPLPSAPVLSPHGGSGSVLPVSTTSASPYPIAPLSFPQVVHQTVVPSIIENVTASMQTVSISRNSRHDRQPSEYISTSLPIPMQASTATTRHTPTSSTDSTSSAAPSATSSATSPTNRHRRDGPLVVDGSVRRR